MLANLSNKTTNKIPIKILKIVIQVSKSEKFGMNNDTFPIIFSSFQGQTPIKDPAINPTIIEIVVAQQKSNQQRSTAPEHSCHMGPRLSAQ